MILERERDGEEKMRGKGGRRGGGKGGGERGEGRGGGERGEQGVQARGKESNQEGEE